MTPPEPGFELATFLLTTVGSSSELLLLLPPPRVTTSVGIRELVEAEEDVEERGFFSPFSPELIRSWKQTEKDRIVWIENGFGFLTY